MRTRVWMVVLGTLLPGVAGPVAAQAPAAPAVADTLALSLEAAESRAARESEEVQLARAGVSLADAQVAATRASALPQVNASLGYTRTLASVFSSAAQPALPDSLRFNPDASLPLEQRVAYLEDKTPLAATGALMSVFGNLPFGRENAYTAALSGSQLLYSGGRVGAALSIARNYRAAARLGLEQQEAQVRLQVRSAYYQALLAQEMADIAQAALAQAESFLAQEQLRRRAGRASELEVMRAEVSRDNLRPQLIQARNGLDLAMLNLKRLVDLPLTQPVRLTTELAPPALEDGTAVQPAPELVTAQRAALQAAHEQVEMREQQVRIARGAFLPNVSLSSAYARQLYPSDVFALDEPWRSDWTVSLQVSLPVFSGFRRQAELQQARVQMRQSELQLAQLREAMELQFERARGEKERALSAIQARQRTVEVAQRVYDLTVLRYERGLATQLEVSDARLSLLQARTHLAMATAEYYTADAGTAGATMNPSSAPAMAAPQVPAATQPTQAGGGAGPVR